MRKPTSAFATNPAAALVCLALAACGGDGGAGAASNGDQSNGLGQPTAAFPEDFGTVQAVRELSDGRVLVADPLGGVLYVVDMEAGTREPIGTEGQGPGEYRQPDTVWPLADDATLVVDLGNARFMTLDANFEFGETSPLSTGDPRSGLVVALPQAVDADGNVYARAMGGGMRMELPDSGAILRIHRADFSVDTVGMFKVPEVTVTETGGPDNRNVSMQQIPLSPADAWGAAPDGSVVIARAGDYHVEWVGTDGSVVAGPAVPYEPVGIGMAEKEEWLAAQGRSGGGVGIMLSMTDGGAMQTSFRRGGMGMGGRDEPAVDDYEWPDVKAPFYDNRLVVDPMNRVWVRRQMPAGEDATYDVFDRSAQRVATYSLPGDRRVVGFGSGAVYVVSFDAFDLNYLERYALPGS